MDRIEKWYRRGEKNLLTAIVQYERQRTGSYRQAAQNVTDNREHYGLDRSIASSTLVDLEKTHRAAFRKYLQKRFPRADFGQSTHEERLSLFLADKNITYVDLDASDEVFVSHSTATSPDFTLAYDFVRMASVNNPSHEPANPEALRLFNEIIHTLVSKS